MIAPGRYSARPIDAALGKTSGGKDQVAVQFEINEGQPHAGELITWFGYFSEKTVDRTLEALEHCGWNGDSLADLSSVGRRDVEIVVAHETWEGTNRAKIQWVNRPGGSGLAMKQALTPGEAQAFDQRMRGTLLARKQKRAQTPGAPDESFNFGANNDKPPV